MSFNTYSKTPGSGRLDGKVCFSKSLADATPINLEYLQDYVKSLQAGGTIFVFRVFSSFVIIFLFFALPFFVYK